MKAHFGRTTVLAFTLLGGVGGFFLSEIGTEKAKAGQQDATPSSAPSLEIGDGTGVGAGDILVAAHALGETKTVAVRFLDAAGDSRTLRTISQREIAELPCDWMWIDLRKDAVLLNAEAMSPEERRERLVQYGKVAAMVEARPILGISAHSEVPGTTLVETFRELHEAGLTWFIPGVVEETPQERVIAVTAAAKPPPAAMPTDAVDVPRPATTMAAMVEEKPVPYDYLTGFGQIPAHSEIAVEATDTELEISIRSPLTARPFWGLEEVRPPVYQLRGHVPILTLLARSEDEGGDEPEAESETEVRIELIPEILSRRINPLAFDAHLELVLRLGGEKDAPEVGTVTIFVKEGEIDTHRLRYRIDRDCLEALGDECWLVSGRPVAQQIRLKAPAGER